MTELLIVHVAPLPLNPEHSFGGLPVVPKALSFCWPRCKTCGGPMQSLGQLRIPETQKLVLLFMCRNEPGMCAEWEADAGGNCAIIVPNDTLAQAQPPEGGATVREMRYGARQVTSQLDNYDAAREMWCKETGSKGREVLGQILGSPAWIQADETPKCGACGKPMRFLAQLEQGPD